MISSFPTPYPDELWYSVICRYHIRSGNLCAKHTLHDLYGIHLCNASLTLCGPVRNILLQIPAKALSVESIVMQHTYFPYFARFFSSDRKEATYQSAVSGDPRAIHKMGITQSNGREQRILRYCPYCMEEDKKRYGEPYWHRLHQLPELPICDRHRCWLSDTEVVYNSHHQFELYPATCTVNLKPVCEKSIPSALFDFAHLVREAVQKPFCSGEDGIRDLFDKLYLYASEIASEVTHWKGLRCYMPIFLAVGLPVT